ncbi:MAG: hypothetical protein ACJ75S_02885 [Solirubrobacterales bacterium]
MVLVWFLALVGLSLLIALAALAVIAIGRLRPPTEPEDAFDLALASVARLQGEAWSAIQELRGESRKGDE